jgi:integrase/recombinase XerD
MRTPNSKAKSVGKPLKTVIAETIKLWRRHHLGYDQIRYVSKEARKVLGIERGKTKQRVIARLSREEEKKLIDFAYRQKGEYGLLIKTLFQTGARVSEFVNIRVQDLFFEETMILINKGKGGKSRYVPILPELAQELKTHLANRQAGSLFESNRNLPYSARRVQQIVKETAEQAKIKKRVHPHLLRHSVATTLLERGMPLEQIQKFLGHSKIETTQVYAESTTEMIKDGYRRALTGLKEETLLASHRLIVL